MRRATVPGRRTRRAAHVRRARRHRADDPEADPRLPGCGRGGLLGAHPSRDGRPRSRVPPDHRGPGEPAVPGMGVRRKRRGLRAGRRACVLPAPALGRVPGPGTARRGGRGMSAPVLAGVGVGPGDPELVTVKAVRVLREADLVLVPVMATGEQGQGPVTNEQGLGPSGGSGPWGPGAGPRGGGVSPRASTEGFRWVAPPDQGRAEATVRAHVTHDRITRVAFALTEGAGIGEREAAWDGAADAAVAAFADGASVVAFATIGDPNVYSTFTYLAGTVRPRVPGLTVATVPGITAMQDLAARSGTVLCEGRETLALLPLTAGIGPFKAALDRKSGV